MNELITLKPTNSLRLANRTLSNHQVTNGFLHRAQNPAVCHCFDPIILSNQGLLTPILKI